MPFAAGMKQFEEVVSTSIVTFPSVSVRGKDAYRIGRTQLLQGDPYS